MTEPTQRLVYTGGFVKPRVVGSPWPGRRSFGPAAGLLGSTLRQRVAGSFGGLAASGGFIPGRAAGRSGPSRDVRA